MVQINGEERHERAVFDKNQVSHLFFFWWWFSILKTSHLKKFIEIPLSKEDMSKEDSINIKKSQGVNEVADEIIGLGCSQGLIGVELGFQNTFFS